MLTSSHSPPRRLERVERGNNGRSERRQGLKRQSDLGDHRDRAFRPNDQASEVIASCTLTATPTRTKDPPVRQNRLETKHVVSSHAVLEAAHAARIRRNVATYRAEVDATRVRGIETSALLDTGTKIARDHAGLDPDDPVSRIDLDHLVETAGRQHDAPGVEDAPPARPVPAPRVTTATPRRVAALRTEATSDVVCGRTTAMGSEEASKDCGRVETTPQACDRSPRRRLPAVRAGPPRPPGARP